jgi:hypothetical protein
MNRGSAENRAAFEEAAVLADAQQRTGLDDFGPDPFREPLAVLLKSLREEAPLNDLGRDIRISCRKSSARRSSSWA